MWNDIYPIIHSIVFGHLFVFDNHKVSVIINLKYLCLHIEVILESIDSGYDLLQMLYKYINSKLCMQKPRKMSKNINLFIFQYPEIK